MLWTMHAAEWIEERVERGTLQISAGLSIVPVVPWEGVPVARGPRRSAAKFLQRCFDVHECTLKRNDD